VALLLPSRKPAVERKSETFERFVLAILEPQYQLTAVGGVKKNMPVPTILSFVRHLHEQTREISEILTEGRVR